MTKKLILVLLPLFWLTSPAAAQVRRLPPLLGPVAPASYPSELSEPLVVEDEAAVQSGRISSSKEGIFQKLSFTGTWLDRRNADDFGLSEMELYGAFAFPMPTREKPLIITPGFETRFIDGPNSPDLPGQLYDAYLQFRWLGTINDCWAADVAVSPGVHSDFERWDDSAIRITGRALGVFTWSPSLKIVLGVAYLDRDDVSLLPAGGLIWTPSDDWNLNLVVPRPRIARRIWYDCYHEDWLYLAGEFGGGSWSIERVGGAQDVVTMRDFRVLFGLERKWPGGAGARLEAGWVFGRRAEYATVTPDIEPDDTVMLRGGITY